MSNQLFEEDAPPAPAPKNGRSPRAARVPEPPEPQDPLRDPFAEEEVPSLPEPLLAPVAVLTVGPRTLPDERQSVTHTLKVGGCEGLLIVGLFADGSPGEVLLMLRRAPRGVSEALDAFTGALTLALPYGVPIGPLAAQLTRLLSTAEAQEAGQYIADYLRSKFG